MDVYLKYAYAVVAANNNITNIDDITDEMIDVEIEESLNKLLLYTDDNSKVVSEGRFYFASKEKLKTEILPKIKKLGNTIKLAVHVTITNMNRSKFIKEVIDNYDKLFTGDVSESNFILLNSAAYISKNHPSGYKIPVRERKLYLLAQITPYKASYCTNDGDKYAIFVNLEFPLLVKYVELFKRNWENRNQDVYISKVSEESKYFLNPPQNRVNYDIKRKYFEENETPLLKYQVLHFLTDIRNIAYFLDEIELYNKLANAVLYELDVNKKKAVPFNLNKHLIQYAVDDKITDLILCLRESSRRTYGEVKSEMVYSIHTVFNSPENKNNLRYINSFRINYVNQRNFNYNNYIEIMEKILELNNKKEIIEQTKTVANSMKSRIWSFSFTWVKENKKPKTDDERLKFAREKYDDTVRDMQYLISAIRNITDFLKLSTNFNRRIGANINIEELFYEIIENEKILSDVKELLNFYLSQPHEKREKASNVKITDDITEQLP